MKNCITTKTLSDQVIISLNKERLTDNILERQDYKDAESRYISRLYSRIQMKKERHLFHICKLYLVGTACGIKEIYNIRTDLHADLCYLYEEWKVVQWAACEITFGFYHKNIDNKRNAMERIRMELPREHLKGRYLSYSLEKFEKALSKYCPNLEGTVHDWCNVFTHVPKLLLLYEEFF